LWVLKGLVNFTVSPLLIHLTSIHRAGKTYALWYLLIQRLKKGYPTIYTINKYSYFFSADGVQQSVHSPDSSEARAWLDTYRTDGGVAATWVLIDACGLKAEEHEGWIWFQPVPWQAVFASSNSWRMISLENSHKFVMNPPTVVEIYTVCVLCIFTFNSRP
jgi:hypothetical protein